MNLTIHFSDIMHTSPDLVKHMHAILSHYEANECFRAIELAVQERSKEVNQSTRRIFAPKEAYLHDTGASENDSVEGVMDALSSGTDSPATAKHDIIPRKEEPTLLVLSAQPLQEGSSTAISSTETSEAQRIPLKALPATHRRSLLKGHLTNSELNVQLDAPTPPPQNSTSSQSSSEKKVEQTLVEKFRRFCGDVVNNELAQIIMIFLISVNSLMMGIATSDWVKENERVDEIFFRFDRSFLISFTLESAMHLIHLGPALFAEGWLVFDLLIVILSWSFESLQIVRAFRIFRAFRLFTRVKTLRDLVMAIGEVMPKMFTIAALLLLIFYIFSVLFTELYADLPLSQSYFSTMDKSLFTCMEMMTLEWAEIAREVISYEPSAWAPISAFICITGFIIFNLVIAVICDAVAVTEKHVRELDGLESDDPEDQLIEGNE